MLFRDVVGLINETVTVDEEGIGTSTDGTPRLVFANKKAIRETEFYQAAAVGMTPDLMFVVRTMDYEGEPKLSYNDKTYYILRTYDKNGEFTELICSTSNHKGLSTKV